MEYWSVGVLRQLGIAPRVAGLRMLSGRILDASYPGLKPWAMVLSRFAAESDRYPAPLLNLESFCNSAEFAVKFRCKQSSSNEN
jgi:hypothetical protein